MHAKAKCEAVKVEYIQIQWIHWREFAYIKEIFEVVPLVTQAV